MHATIVVNYRSTPRPERPKVSIFVGAPRYSILSTLLTPVFEGQVFERPQDCLEPVRDLLNTLPNEVINSWTIILSTIDGYHTLKNSGVATSTQNPQEVIMNLAELKNFTLEVVEWLPLILTPQEVTQ